MRRLTLILLAFAVVLGGAVPGLGADRLRGADKARAEREKARKAERTTDEPVVDTEQIGPGQLESTRIGGAPEGKWGKITDQKADYLLPEHDIAGAYRKEMKVEREKVGAKDLTAVTEEEERRARARAARQQARAARVRRNVIISLFFDW